MNITPPSYPKSIVCLSSGCADILYRIGAWDRVVGVSGFTHLPADAQRKAKVGGFTTIYVDKVLELKPDLVISYSHLQANIAAQLVASGVNVLALNQRSIQEILNTVLLLGSVVGREEQAEQLAARMSADLDEAARAASELLHHPRVFFEEWSSPIISASRWISESIELAGGVDIFPELRNVVKGRDRAVEPSEVLTRDPEIVVASWCGRKVDLQSIYKREGWEDISAVRNKQVYWLKSKDILEAGPSLVAGVRELHRIIAEVSDKRPANDSVS
ncbi:MAG: cobalamin-binding protein [Dehalococcoidia bacterium]|nr:cobalamin-binding protein [Dehalococcoidia bacterium]